MNFGSIQVFARLRAGSQEASHAGVANRTAKGSICRISVLFAEIKALFLDVALLACLPRDKRLQSG
jgi:hypothetical protein